MELLFVPSHCDFPSQMDHVEAILHWVQTELNRTGYAEALNRASLSQWCLFASISLCFAYVVRILIHAFCFCPTGHIPGPVLTRLGKFYYHLLFYGGSISEDILELHRRYGNAYLAQ